MGTFSSQTDALDNQLGQPAPLAPDISCVKLEISTGPKLTYLGGSIPFRWHLPNHIFTETETPAMQIKIEGKAFSCKE